MPSVWVLVVRMPCCRKCVIACVAIEFVNEKRKYSLSEIKAMSLDERKANLPKARLISDESELPVEGQAWVKLSVQDYVAEISYA